MRMVIPNIFKRSNISRRIGKNYLPDGLKRVAEIHIIEFGKRVF